MEGRGLGGCHFFFFFFVEPLGWYVFGGVEVGSKLSGGRNWRDRRDWVEVWSTEMGQWLEGLLEQLGWRQRSWSHGESKVLLCLVGWAVVFAPSQSLCPIFWAESCSKLQDLRFRQASRDPCEVMGKTL